MVTGVRDNRCADVTASLCVMTDTRRTTLALMTLSLVGTIAMTACSTTGEPNPTTDPASSMSATMVSSPASSPSPAGNESTPEAPAPDPELPNGFQWAESSTQGIRFAVPGTWTAVDAKQIIGSGSEADIESAAQDMGLSVDQLRQAAEQIDIIVMGPAVDGFAPNINVVPTSLTELPTQEALAAEAESVGASVGQGSVREAPGGQAMVLPYVLELETANVQGRAIVAPVPGGFTSITVSHINAEDADALTDQILASLHTI